ncbi:MAG: anti-sigma factor domain-containing protein [Streptosporangiaceae bacterium]
MEAAGADAHTLVGAYAMDAVSGADRARFEQHLAGCEACQSEVRELREATARLAAAAAVSPRAELKAQALRAAAQTRQLPPLPGDMDLLPGGSPARPALLRGPGPVHRARPPRRAAPLLSAAAAAVLVAVIAVAAVVMHAAQHRLDMAQGRSMAVARVLNARDAARLTSRVSTGGTATVVMSHAQRRLVFTAAGLRALPAAHRYELWLMSPSGDKPAGMLSAGHGGMVSPVVVSGLSAGDQIGMTIEPSAGSAKPTRPAVLLMSLQTRGS